MRFMQLSEYKNTNSYDVFYRFLWMIIWRLLISWMPRKYPSFWFKFWLKLFGAEIPSTSTIYNSAKIYRPNNLVMGEYSTISDNVNFYNVARIIVGSNTIISQGAYLCAASHDYKSEDFTLLKSPIVIGSNSWIAAEAFIGPGVKIGDRVIVAARSVVVKDIENNSLVVGNPAVLKKRFL